jgi:hypothetical protein
MFESRPWPSIVVCITAFMFGCAPANQWVKAGASQQDFSTDSYDCEKDARQSGYYGGGLVGAVNMQAFFNRCLGAHGWSLENASSPSSLITTDFTHEQWEAGRSQCRAEAAAQSQATGGADFANAFDRCMKSHGL